MIESEYKSPFAVTFLGFSSNLHGKNLTSSPQADLMFKSPLLLREEEDTTLRRKFCLFPGWSTRDVSPRAKLERPHDALLVFSARSRKARCATKVRFCRLARAHEEAVLEDEEAKHIERMMTTTTRDVATETMEKSIRRFLKEKGDAMKR